MSRSTLVKNGSSVADVKLAKAAAKSAAVSRDESAAKADENSGADKSTSAGKPADAFSKHAIQHDLSVGDGA